jgi:serine/threonine protein phosphatase 1
MRKDSIIVIGDCHGCYKTLMALITKLPKDVPICITGDLVDRGPKSKEVVQYCIDNNIPVVMGNHENMMIGGTYEDQDTWFINGGIATVQSYLKEDIDITWMDYTGLQTLISYVKNTKTYKKHTEWMKKLPLYLEFPDIKNNKGEHLLVTHSSAAAVWGKYDKNHRYFENHVLWERPGNIKSIPDIYNVFGHTQQKFKATVEETYACIDTGCVFNSHIGYGKLTGLQFPEMVTYEQENIEDEKD